MSETTIAYKDLVKFAIVDMVVHDVNEERLKTALILDFWLSTFGYKLYCPYPTLKDIKPRNWKKPVKDRQYPGPNWTSWPVVHRRDFDDYTSGREYEKTASKKAERVNLKEEKGKEAGDLQHDIYQTINEEFTSKIQLLSALPKPPPTVEGQLVKYSADQSQTYSAKQPHTIGQEPGIPDLSFSTSPPNVDVASQNLIVGDEDSQFPMDDDSETSASETTQTVDGEISIPQFGVTAVYPTQSGANVVYPTQSGVNAVNPTQS
ncbi:hypothetical protein OUZ56_016618 [Daphnia magna]|uniref:Uncharacterized protein n=1 Tax=Daphnia magna TaxID=35525 RepID=A0ABR0AR36_9CRUS|nr:hypothetical protein OUZ56_016618 [Daphnia magna]